MATSPEQPTVEVELCIRSLASTNNLVRQSELIDRLEELVDASKIASFDITVWGDKIPLNRPPRTDTSRQLYRLLGEFEQWADQPGRTIKPFFETQTLTTELVTSDREIQVMSLPTFALAEFHDGELVWVSPHSESNTTHSVDDHLDAIDSTEQRHESLGQASETVAPPTRSEVISAGQSFNSELGH